MKKIVLTLISFLVLTTICKAGFLSVQQDSAWTLEKCIRYALEQNVHVRKSILSNETSIIYVDQAKAQRFPSLSASVNQNFNWSRSQMTSSNGLNASNGTSYSLNSGVTLFNYSRINNLIKQAELDIRGGMYSLEATKY